MPVVPEVGRTCFISLVFSTTDYGVLGPFSVGSFLRRLWFSVSGNAEGVITVGAVLGASREASAGAFRSGAPLFDSSDQTLGGQPVVVFQVTAGVSPQIVVPCGRRVHEGARYVVVMATCGAAPTVATVTASIEVLRLVMPGSALGPGA